MERKMASDEYRSVTELAEDNIRVNALLGSEIENLEKALKDLQRQGEESRQEYLVDREAILADCTAIRKQQEDNLHTVAILGDSVEKFRADYGRQIEENESRFLDEKRSAAEAYAKLCGEMEQGRQTAEERLKSMQSAFEVKQKDLSDKLETQRKELLNRIEEVQKVLSSALKLNGNELKNSEKSLLLELRQQDSSLSVLRDRVESLDWEVRTSLEALVAQNKEDLQGIMAFVKEQAAHLTEGQRQTREQVAGKGEELREELLKSRRWNLASLALEIVLVILAGYILFQM